MSRYTYRNNSVHGVLLVPALALVLVSASAAGADEHAHHHQGHGRAMELDVDGMVMNSNEDQLPKDCDRISADIELVVQVGRRYAERGLTFGYSQHEWRVPPCARIRVSLVNEDEVRHQWMMHGLPRYLYPQGMFHLEVNGGKTKQGTVIVPSGDATYLVHCDISHHMEQGLKGQIIVGAGAGNLSGIPGISAPRNPDVYD